MGGAFLGLKILQSCHAASAHQYLFFNCWLELTRPQYFQAATASREWSTFLADLSCRIFISGSLSSNTHAAHDFTETLNMFQLQKEWKIWEKTRKSGQNKVNLAVCVASLWTNESLFQYTKLILIPVMRISYFSITSFLFSKNKWLYSHKWLKWMGVVRVN